MSADPGEGFAPSIVLTELRRAGHGRYRRQRRQLLPGGLANSIVVCRVKRIALRVETRWRSTLYSRRAGRRLRSHLALSAAFAEVKQQANIGDELLSTRTGTLAGHFDGGIPRSVFPVAGCLRRAGNRYAGDDAALHRIHGRNRSGWPGLQCLDGWLYPRRRTGCFPFRAASSSVSTVNASGFGAMPVAWLQLPRVNGHCHDKPALLSLGRARIQVHLQPAQLAVDQGELPLNRREPLLTSAHGLLLPSDLASAPEGRADGGDLDGWPRDRNLAQARRSARRLWK